MTTMAKDPLELAAALKAAQIETGRFFQPCATPAHGQVELGWDGVQFVLRTSEGQCPLQNVARLLPATLH